VLVGPYSWLFWLNFVPIAFVFVFVWLVVSALRRIGKGVEEIAETLRRMESKGPQSSPLT
jgi:hypothetical protein